MEFSGQVPFLCFISQEGPYPYDILHVQCVLVAAEVRFDHSPPGSEVALWFAIEFDWIPHFEPGR